MVSTGKAIPSRVVTSTATRPDQGAIFRGQRSGQVVASTPSLLAHRRQGRCFAYQHDASLPAPATQPQACFHCFPALAGGLPSCTRSQRLLEHFQEAVIVTEDVIEKIEELARLAPLHNPPNAQGIRVAAEIFPGKPQVAVFDTGLHQTLPPYAFHYPIPYEYYERLRVRRYGFHGTSYHYVTYEAARRLGKPFEQAQFISAHLGNGYSATAVRNGRSTMGLKPLEGLMMVHGAVM
jgi:hypothetical protein